MQNNETAEEYAVNKRIRRRIIESDSDTDSDSDDDVIGDVDALEDSEAIESNYHEKNAISEQECAEQYDALDGTNPYRQDARFRHWVFTLHKPLESTKELWKQYEADHNDKSPIVYAVIGSEICPSTGNHHWQGYVSMRNPCTWSAMRKRIGPGCNGDAWLRTARGTATQNRRYCTKDGEFQEFGTLPVNKQGQRTDYQRLTEELVKTGTIDLQAKVAAEDYKILGTFARSAKYLDRLKHDLSKPRQWKTKVVWCVGDTGTGKSYYINKQYPEAYWVTTGGTTGLWFCGYDRHKTVVFDDFRTEVTSFKVFLNLLDEYPCQVQAKGVGSINFVPHTIVISCPHTPFQLSWGCGENMLQLTRRVTELLYFKRSPDGLGGTFDPSLTRYPAQEFTDAAKKAFEEGKELSLEEFRGTFN